MVVKRGSAVSLGLYMRSLWFALRGQASAYGFTLVIWGTGALAIHQIGEPGPADVFAYVGGALSAAMLVVAGAFGFWSSLQAEEPELRAHSAMHCRRCRSRCPRAGR